MKIFDLVAHLCWVLMICLWLSGSAMAAPVGLGEAAVAEELRALTAAVDNLTRQMEKQSGDVQLDTRLRKLDIAIAYLNFRSRRIEMFERDLQATRSTRNRLDDVMEQLRREEDGLSESFNDNQGEALQRAREELRFRRQGIKDRISRMDEEIVMLENRIMDMQSQIDSVESFVQKNLAF